MISLIFINSCIYALLISVSTVVFPLMIYSYTTILCKSCNFSGIAHTVWHRLNKIRLYNKKTLKNSHNGPLPTRLFEEVSFWPVIYSLNLKLDQEIWFCRTHLDDFVDKNWTKLYQIRPYYTKFDHYGQMWTILDKVWTILNNFGPFWFVLKHFYTLWTILAYFGQFLTIFDNIWQFLTILNHFRQL